MSTFPRIILLGQDGPAMTIVYYLIDAMTC
jgi:hypothetical protein